MEKKKNIRARVTACTFLTFCSMWLILPSPARTDDVETHKGSLHMKGGVFGQKSKDIVNTGTISGHGVFEGKKLTNRGSMRFSGGETTVKTTVENFEEIEVIYQPAVFEKNVTNHGKMKITDTTVVFNGTYTEHGVYSSDPSNNYFNDLVVGTGGYLIGGAGDNFIVRGDFVSSSTMNTDWYTAESNLEFRTGLDLDTAHDFHITGTDSGATTAGYLDNFAWDTLNVASGNSITLYDGNATPTGALYVNVIQGVQTSGTTVTNISGSAGINIYYLASEAGNAYLGGLSYNLTGTGQLLPISGGPAIPTLSEWGMIIMILLLITVGIFVIRRRQEQ